MHRGIAYRPPRAGPFRQCCAWWTAVGLALPLLLAAGSGPFPAPPAFTASPLALDEIRAIVPLGNLNPRGGHVLPTDHVYLDYGGKPDLVVFAPAAGTVFAIREQSKGDSKVEIRVDHHLCYYLAHLHVQPGIGTGSRVKAGQAIGRVSARSWLDLGASDARVKLEGFLNPARYPASTLHTVSPLALFAEPLSSQLLAKVAREGADKHGKIDFDQPGKLAGNWFHHTLSPEESQRGEPGIWARHLAFVYDVGQPKAVRISIGGTVAPAGVYAVPPGAPDPAGVGMGAGLVKYPLLPPPQDPPQAGEFSTPVGILLVQLAGDNQLKVEFFPTTHPAAIAGFTSQAGIYER